MNFEGVRPIDICSAFPGHIKSVSRSSALLMSVAEVAVRSDDIHMAAAASEHREKLEVLEGNIRPESHLGELRELCDGGLGIRRRATVGNKT